MQRWAKGHLAVVRHLRLQNPDGTATHDKPVARVRIRSDEERAFARLYNLGVSRQGANAGRRACGHVNLRPAADHELLYLRHVCARIVLVAGECRAKPLPGQIRLRVHKLVVGKRPEPDHDLAEPQVAAVRCAALPAKILALIARHAPRGHLVVWCLVALRVAVVLAPVDKRQTTRRIDGCGLSGPVGEGLLVLQKTVVEPLGRLREGGEDFRAVHVLRLTLQQIVHHVAAAVLCADYRHDGEHAPEHDLVAAVGGAVHAVFVCRIPQHTARRTFACEAEVDDRLLADGVLENPRAKILRRLVCRHWLIIEDAGRKVPEPLHKIRPVNLHEIAATRDVSGKMHEEPVRQLIDGRRNGAFPKGDPAALRFERAAIIGEIAYLERSLARLDDFRLAYADLAPALQFAKFERLVGRHVESRRQTLRGRMRRCAIPTKRRTPVDPDVLAASREPLSRQIALDSADGLDGKHLCEENHLGDAHAAGMVVDLDVAKSNAGGRGVVRLADEGQNLPIARKTTHIGNRLVSEIPHRGIRKRMVSARKNWRGIVNLHGIGALRRERIYAVSRPEVSFLSSWV